VRIKPWCHTGRAGRSYMYNYIFVEKNTSCEGAPPLPTVGLRARGGSPPPPAPSGCATPRPPDPAPPRPPDPATPRPHDRTTATARPLALSSAWKKGRFNLPYQLHSSIVGLQPGIWTSAILYPPCGCPRYPVRMPIPGARVDDFPPRPFARPHRAFFRISKEQSPQWDSAKSKVQGGISENRS